MFVNMSLKKFRDGRQYRDGSVITGISFAATFVYWKYFRTFKLIWKHSGLQAFVNECGNTW